MRIVGLCSILFLVLSPVISTAEGTVGVGPLRPIPLTRLNSIVPGDTHILIERSAIESFLAALEGAPPDWATVYGHGHHDPGHDDRLFNLNRERDARRDANPVLNWRVAFVWPGELSRYDRKIGGYAVSVGPEFNQTDWGVVRFKPEDLPTNLRVIPDPKQQSTIRRRVQKEKVELSVVIIGMLIPNEAIVYDFSHDREGLGLIMPVVRVERMEYLLK